MLYYEQAAQERAAAEAADPAKERQQAQAPLAPAGQPKAEDTTATAQSGAAGATMAGGTARGRPAAPQRGMGMGMGGAPRGEKKKGFF